MHNQAMARVLRVWALDAAAFADVIADQEPSWGSEQFEFAGGSAVLCGPGMYVNAAIAAGLDEPLDEAEWERFELRCEAVGVTPSFEVSPSTNHLVRDQLAARGYAKGSARSALSYTFDPDVEIPENDPAFMIEPANHELLSLWQATSAAGWGHTTVAARRVSDSYARAAAVVDGENLLMVRDAVDGRPVGCASTTIREGIATLGGMSTLPTERRRGVQAALIHHRLRTARSLGCDTAMATAAPGGDSERNLVRHGFIQEFAVETYVSD